MPMVLGSGYGGDACKRIYLAAENSWSSNGILFCDIDIFFIGLVVICPRFGIFAHFAIAT